MKKFVTAICAALLVGQPLGIVATVNAEEVTEVTSEVKTSLTPVEKTADMGIVSYVHYTGQKDRNNPEYTITVPIASREIPSFSGAFANATVTKTEILAGRTVLTVTKPYVGPTFDDNGNLDNQGTIQIAGKTFVVEDTYLSLPKELETKGMRSFKPDDLSKILKGAGDVFKAFTDKAILGDASASMLKGFAFANGVSPSIQMVFAILSLFQEKDKDPVLMKLNEIKDQLGKMDNKIDFTTNEILNALDRNAYTDFLNGYSGDYSKFRNSYIDPSAVPFLKQLNSIAAKVGIPKNPDGTYTYTTAANIQKIQTYLDTTAGTADAAVLASLLAEIHFDRNTTYSHGYYTQFMDYLDALDGTSRPYVPSISAPDAFKVFRGYESVVYDWQNETFAARESINTMLYQEAVQLVTPLHFALIWDHTENLKLFQEADAAIKALIDQYGSEAKIPADLQPTYKAYVSNRAIAEQHGDRDNDLLALVYAKLESLKAKSNAEATTLTAEKTTFNNGTIYSYRSKQKFNNSVTKKWYTSEGYGTTDFGDYDRGVSWKLPNNTWTSAEYKAMEYAAQIRGTTLALELRNAGVRGLEGGGVDANRYIWTPESRQVVTGGKAGWSNTRYTDWYNTLVKIHERYSTSNDCFTREFHTVHSWRNFVWEISDGGGVEWADVGWGFAGILEKAK